MYPLDIKSSPSRTGRGWILYYQDNNIKMSSISLNLLKKSYWNTQNSRRDTSIPSVRSGFGGRGYGRCTDYFFFFFLVLGGGGGSPHFVMGTSWSSSTKEKGYVSSKTSVTSQSFNWQLLNLSQSDRWSTGSCNTLTFKLSIVNSKQ